VWQPDSERTHIVESIHRPHPGLRGLGGAGGQLQQHVRGKLAPYEYPKEIEFLESLPMTTTGKVQRRVLRLREEERKGRGKA